MGAINYTSLQKVSSEFFFDFYNKKLSISDKSLILSPYVHHQIIYCLNQQGTLWINGQAFNVPKMHLIIIQSQCQTSLKVKYSHDSNILHCGFTGDLHPLLLHAQLLTHNIYLLPIIQKDHRMLSHIFNKLHLGYPYVDDMLNALLTMIAELSTYKSMMNDHHPIIQQAMCYIHDNFNQSLTIEEIATYCATKPRYLAYLFRQELDIPPSKYLTLIRINTAKVLLIDCSVKIEHIAYQIGYQNISIFSKAFKRYTSYSPSEWRAIFYQPHLL